MKTKWISLAALSAMAFAITGFGCDRPAPVVRDSLGRPITELGVTPQDPPIYEAVQKAENARVNYRYRLEVLNSYYLRTGNFDKRIWAEREIANLDQAQWFKWQGIQQVPAPGETIANADEVLLVERVVLARQDWIAAMKQVADLYAQRGMSTPERCARVALERLDPVKTYMYFLDAEIPPATLRPTASIPQANALFDEAKSLFKQGKGFVPMFGTNVPRERRALELFRQLIRDHQNSDKIALAAYYIGDIYKEYFDENVRAVAWYQRAWEWDPNVTEPARFQAATVYDKRLRNYPMAVKCYEEALRRDPPRLANFDHARERLKELTGKTY